MAGALSDLIRQLSQEDWVGGAYDTVLARHAYLERERYEEPTTYVRPSAAGDPCERAMELYLLGHREPFSAGLVERMKNGKQVHERVTGNMGEAGVLVSYETRLTVYDDGSAFVGSYDDEAEQRGRRVVRWSGEPDLLTRPLGAMSGQITIGEIKSANQWRTRRMPPQVDDLAAMTKKLTAVEERYVIQTVQYWVMFREHYTDEPVAESVFFFIEDTDTQRHVIRWMDPSAYADQAFERSDRARTAAGHGELLDTPFTRGRKQCRSCGHRRVCWAIADGKEEETTWVTAALTTAREMISGR